MITYPFINLPDYYTQLLRNSMQGIEFNSNHFNSYVYENKPFFTLMENHFQDIDADLRIDAILKSMTWKGVRNRMARLFIHYELHGKFGLGEDDMKHLNDLLFWEDRLSAYNADGFSRTFLLAFYFKIGSFQTQKYYNENQRKNFVMKEDIVDLFKYCKSRTNRVDWLYVMMDHFVDYFGKKKTLALLEDRLPYSEIFSLLSNEQQADLTSAFLSYGASISESEIFTSETILV